MGLGVAIAGSIICVTMIAVLSIVYSMSGQVFDINSSRSQNVDVDNVLAQTDMTVDNVLATSGSQYVNFTLTNTGNEKLWNYDKFDVVINYTASVLGSPSIKTEHITYSRDWQTISVNSVTSDSQTCTSCTLSHTVAGTYKLLVVGVSVEDSTTVSSVTYSGQSLTKIRSDQVSGNGRHSELWYLINPPSGTADVVATLSQNKKIVIGAISLSGVRQVSPIVINNGDTDASGNTDPSVSLTTTADNAFIIDVVSTTGGPMTPDVSQTERWDLAQGQLRGSSSTKQATTQTSYTMSWTNDGGTDQWAISAAAIRPANVECGPSGTSGTDDWLISSISSDYSDPDIINTNEGASICTKLTYPVYNSGVVQVTVSTDVGYTASGEKTMP